MNDASLNRRYAGKRAKRYDARREPTERFQAETSAFERFMDRVRPDVVIDCPCGTGRWFDACLALGARIEAIDISSDMIDIAQGKFGDAAGRIRYQAMSMFDADLTTSETGDSKLFVCTRFLNWITRPQADKALERIAGTACHWAIIGVSLRPADLPFHRQLAMWFRLWRDNRKRMREGDAMQHVHSESWFLKKIDQLGWTIEDRQLIFSSQTRNNFFFLLRHKNFDPTLIAAVATKK